LLVAVALAGVLPQQLGLTRVQTPAFISDLLGQHDNSSSANIPVAPNVTAKIDNGSFGLSTDRGVVSLSAADAGSASWDMYSHGATRQTPFGLETVTVSTNQIEDSLVVGSHQGSKLWSWKLDAGTLTPRVGNDGSIGFLDGHALTPVTIQPVRILDSAGRDVTPAGLRWTLSNHGGSWWLQLPLNDAHLPTSYVIDPGIVLHGTPASGSNGSGGSTTLVLNTPTGVAINDLLIAQVTFRSSGASTTLTLPACGCWTLIGSRQDVGSNMSQALYYHVATGAEPANYTWTIGTSNRATGGIIGYAGVDHSSSPIDVNSAAIDSSGASSSPAAPSVTTAGNNEMLVAFFGIRSGDTFTPPAGMTEEWDVSAGGSSPASEAADVLQASAGASGAKTATATGGAANWIAQLVALKPDITPPSANTLSSTSGSAYVSGTTLYYNGTAGGNFQLSDTVTDAQSGPASATFPALGGSTSGWAHTAQTVSTPAGGPYVTTNDFIWAPGTSNSPTEAVTSTDNAGNTSSATTLTFTNDSTNPTGSITAPASSSSVSGNAVTISTNALDTGGSGVGSVVFQSSPAGAGTWTTIGTVNSAPFQMTWDTTVIPSGPYDIQAIITDHVGNTITASVTSVTVLDVTPPTNSIALNSVSPAGSAFKSGNTIYYRGTGGGSGGSFQLTNTLFDAGSGPASSNFPALVGGTNWTHTAELVNSPPSGPYTTSNNFTWSEGASSSPTEAVQGSDHATPTPLTTTTTLTFTNDSTNPTGSITTPVSSTDVSGTIAVTTNSADAGSGVATVKFEESPTGAGTWSTIGTASSSPYTVNWNTVPVTEGVYDIRATTTDNVGNSFISPTVTSVLVDNVPPTGNIQAPGTPVKGTVGLTSTDAADDFSGVATVAFQREPGGSGGAGPWTTINTDATSPYSYSWDTTTVSDGQYDLRVLITDKSGNTFGSARINNWRIDNTAPNNNISLNTVSPAGHAYMSGNTVYYLGTGGGAGGSFQLSNAVSDFGGSGAASSTFPAPGGTTTGWTPLHTAQTINTPSGGPYVTTSAFAWTEGTSSAPTEAVTSTDVVGNTSGATTLTFTNDITAPTGNVTAPAASSNIRGAAVAVTSSSADAGSGVASAQFFYSADGGTTWISIGTDNNAGGGWSVNWNTTLLADGLYQLKVTTTDHVSNAFTSAAITNVRIDNTAPTGTLTAPGSPYRASETLSSGDAADGGSGVASVAFQYSVHNLNSWTTIATDSTSPYSTSWNTTTVADGFYDLRAVITDNAGNATNSALVSNVLVDNTVPTGSITAPAASANVAGSAVTVSSNSADPGGANASGVANALFQFKTHVGGSWANVAAADTTSPYSVSWDTTGLNGSYDLQVITTDVSGNTATSAAVTVTVDNTAPTGSITAPAASANVSGSSVTVSSNSADTGGSGVASAQFQSSPQGAGTWTNISVADTTSPYSVVWNTTAGVSDGQYDLRVVTTDNAGNVANSAPVTVTVDNTNPTGSITAPAASANVRGNAVAVSSNSADTGGSGVLNALFQYKTHVGGSWTNVAAADTTFAYSVNWNTTALADGQYDLQVITTDNAGNTSTSAAVTVTVDNTNPTGSISAPAAASNVTGSNVSVTSNSADGGSGVLNDQFQFKTHVGGSWANIGSADTSSPYSATWDTTGLNGSYDVQVITTDNAGNIFTSAPVNVTVDNTAPTGSITAPSPSGVTVGGSAVTVSSNSADGGSGVASAQFLYSSDGGTTWTPIATDTTSPYSVTWDSTGAADGPYQLEVITTDNVGLANTSAPFSVNVSNSALPTGEITAPAAAAFVGGASVPVSSSSADTNFGVKNALFQYSLHNANSWTNVAAADTTSPYSVNWNTTALGDGQYDLQVITTNNNNNAYTSNIVTVTVDNTAPAGSITAPAASANVRGSSVTVSSNTTDTGGSGVASVQFQYKTHVGGSWTNIGAAATTSPYSATWDTTGLNGSYDLRAVQTDNLGNAANTAVVTVTADNTNPTGTITAPAAAAFVGGNSVTVSSNSADGGSGVASAQFQYAVHNSGSFNNIGAADTTSPYSVPWDTTSGVPDGQYDLRAVTTDNAGNVTNGASIVVNVDNTGPAGSITAPAVNANVRGSSVTVSSNTTDTGGSGVASVQFQRSPHSSGTWTNIGGLDTTGPYNMTWNTTALSDGQYDLQAIETDNVGNVSTTALITVRVDNTNPTGSISAPAAASNVTGSNVSVTSNSADGGSGVANAQFQFKTHVGGSWANIGSADTTSPYSASWDTTGLNGSYDVQVITTDAAGNTFTSAAVAVTVDNTAPTGSITAPAAASFVGGNNVSVTSNSADGGSGVASAQFQFKTHVGGSWANIGAAATSSPYSATWDTTGLNGSYDLQVITTDNVGNVFTSAAVTVTADNTGPAGSITAPAANANVRGSSVTVSANTTDAGGSGVASVQFQRSPHNAGTWTNVGGLDTTSPYSVVWDTTAVPDGQYDLQAIETDNVGHVSTTALITVRVDNTNPTGSISAPASNANVRGNSVTVSSSSADGGSGVANAQFQYVTHNGSSWNNIGGPDSSSPYNASWNTTALSDGQYDLRVTTTDNAGNTFTSAIVTVRVDNTNPTGSITAPAPAATVGGSAVTVNANSADTGGSGIANAQFQYTTNGGSSWTNIGSADTTSPYSAAWDTTALTSGNQYDLRVITTDNAGNTFTSSPVVTVTVNNTLPTGEITAPGAGQVVGGSSVSVQSNSADLLFGVANAQFQRSPAGAGTWTNIGAADTTSPYSVSWNTTSLADGQYDLQVITTNLNNNTYTSNIVTVTVDNTGPAGGISAPAANAAVSGSSVTVSSNASDPGSGVQQVQFQRSPSGAGTWTNIGAADTTSPYSVSWNTTALGDGLYDLRDVGTDNLGNVSNSAPVTVRVDNTPPAASITAPSNGALVSGTAVTVTATATDTGGSGVAGVTFSYSADGGTTWTVIGTATTAPYTVSWNTINLPIGPYDLEATATDNAGNAFTTFPSSVVTVTADNSAPTLSYSSLTNVYANGNNLYYVPGSIGGFTVTATPWVNANPTNHVTFPALASGWFGGGQDNSSPYQQTYTFFGSQTQPGAPEPVVVTDNTATPSQPTYMTLTPDNTAPVSSIKCNVIACSNGWYNSTVSVTLNGADSGSGVQVIRYTTDGSTPSMGNGSTYTTPILVASTTTIKYQAYDNLGNAETTNSQTIQIESVVPTGSLTAPTTGTHWGTKIAISSNSADTGGSGVGTATFQFQLQGAGTWTQIGSPDATAPYSVNWDDTHLAAGAYNLRVITVDNAGNTFTSGMLSLNVPKKLTMTVTKPKVSTSGANALIKFTAKPGATVKVTAVLTRGSKVVARFTLTVKAGNRKEALKVARTKMLKGTYTLTLTGKSADTQSIKVKTSFKVTKDLTPKPSF
jgi:hypothetical protein